MPASEDIRRAIFEPHEEAHLEAVAADRSLQKHKDQSGEHVRVGAPDI